MTYRHRRLATIVAGLLALTLWHAAETALRARERARWEALAT